MTTERSEASNHPRRANELSNTIGADSGKVRDLVTSYRRRALSYR
jgi:hypothetical protein